MLDHIFVWAYEHPILGAFLLPVPVLLWMTLGLSLVLGASFDKAESWYGVIKTCSLYILIPIFYFLIVGYAAYFISTITIQ